MDLDNKKWKEFIMEEVFDDIVNSKAYHKNQLKSFEYSKLPYITRTTYNNGLELLIEDENYSKNPKNTIVFGAESATFFYEPFEYITGNKMYYITDKHFNKYVCLFLVGVLNNVVKDNFGYSRGLTGSRLKQQRVLLPVNDNDLPDYEFMESYIKNKEKELIKKQMEYIESKTLTFNAKDLNSLQWKEFYINEVFENIQRGKRLTKANFISGTTPYISSSATTNGVDSFVGNEEKVRIFENCLTLANSGSVGSTFYHPYSFVASDHVTHLKNDKFNKYIYLFLASIIKRLEEKYNFNREINDARLKNEVIMLPITDDGDINYEFMENYMRTIEAENIEKYLAYLNEKKDL